MSSDFSDEIKKVTQKITVKNVDHFFQVSADSSRLHSILLYSDKTSTDETFSKTALEWAVENNDRLCTTEILHQVWTN